MASLKKRGKTYYAQFYIGNQQKRVCLNTASLQLAKEKLRQLESAQMQGHEQILPTQTPLTEAVQKFLDYINTAKSYRSVIRDSSILRLIFGPLVLCPT